MKRKLYLGILTLSLCVSIIGCGKIDNNNSDNTNADKEISEKSPTNESADNNTDETPSESPGISETSSPEDVKTSEPLETPEPKTGKLSAKQQYSDASRVVKVLGLKEYNELKGDDYTDKPNKKKKFLVLFLSIRNTGSEEDYINPNYITAKVDGKQLEHTFLVNEPKNYPTLFTHIPAGGSIGGFVVWEVPQNWKKFEVEYSGWKDIDGLTIKANFTPKDLFNPLIYNNNDY